MRMSSGTATLTSLRCSWSSSLPRGRAQTRPRRRHLQTSHRDGLAAGGFLAAQKFMVPNPQKNRYLKACGVPAGRPRRNGQLELPFQPGQHPLLPALRRRRATSTAWNRMSEASAGRQRGPGRGLEGRLRRGLHPRGQLVPPLLHPVWLDSGAQPRNVSRGKLWRRWEEPACRRAVLRLYPGSTASRNLCWVCRGVLVAVGQPGALRSPGSGGPRKGWEQDRPVGLQSLPKNWLGGHQVPRPIPGRTNASPAGGDHRASSRPEQHAFMVRGGSEWYVRGVLSGLGYSGKESEQEFGASS